MYERNSQSWGHFLFGKGGVITGRKCNNWNTVYIECVKVKLQVIYFK